MLGLRIEDHDHAAELARTQSNELNAVCANTWVAFGPFVRHRTVGLMVKAGLGRATANLVRLCGKLTRDQETMTAPAREKQRSTEAESRDAASAPLHAGSGPAQPGGHGSYRLRSPGPERRLNP